MRVALLLLAVALAGCRAAIPDGIFACTGDGDCPPGQTCQGGFCSAGGAGLDASRPDAAGVDAAGVDAAGTDGGGVDAALPDAGPTDGCIPRACAALECGPGIANGCGGLLDCGACTDAAHTCGGGGPSLCGEGPCDPLECADLGASCGSPADGCGAMLDCGTCPADQACRGGACVPCPAPIPVRTCTLDADCLAGSLCRGGYCLGVCGHEASLATSLANVRGGATIVGATCLNNFALTTRSVTIDGCPAYELVQVIPTSPAPGESRFYVNTIPLDGALPPSPTTVAMVDVTVSSAVDLYLGAYVAVSPAGTQAVFGWTTSEPGYPGEIARVRFSDGAVHRTTANGNYDAVWLDETRLLVVAQYWFGHTTPAVYWLRSGMTGFVDEDDLVTDIGSFNGSLALLSARSTILVGGVPASTWPDGMTGHRIFAVPTESILASDGTPSRPSPLPAYGTGTVRRFAAESTFRAVGDRLIGPNDTFSAIQMRTVTGADPGSLAVGPASTLFLQGGVNVAALDDRHALITDGYRALTVRLP